MPNKTKKNIILTEYSFIYEKTYQNKFLENDKAVAVSKEQFKALHDFVVLNTQNDEDITYQYLKIESKENITILKAKQYVGIIQLKDGTTVEFLPKITNIDEIKETKKIFLKILKTLKNSTHIKANFANLDIAKLPLLEIFIRMFIDEFFILVKKGVKSSYISKEDNLMFLKGKLKVKEQIKYNFIHKERFFVSYDEYSPNMIENRLIKSTLLYLLRITKNTKINNIYYNYY